MIYKYNGLVHYTPTTPNQSPHPCGIDISSVHYLLTVLIVYKDELLHQVELDLLHYGTHLQTTSFYKHNRIDIMLFSYLG